MNNYKKLSIKNVYPEFKSFQQLSFINNFIFWVDNLSSAAGKRNAIFAKPFNSDVSCAQNLTGENFYIKNSFHGYGGKSYKCFYYEEKFYLLWIDQITNSLWLQNYKIVKSKDKKTFILEVESCQRKLTVPLIGNFDGSFVLFNGLKIFGLFEQNEKDYLFSIDITEGLKELTFLKEFDGFVSSLSCNDDQTLLSWIEWKEYNMAWEKNDLIFAKLNRVGEINKIFKFKNKDINHNRSISFFQPLWISKNTLVCSEDSSGWWNLLFLEISEIGEIKVKNRIKKEFFEYGLPEWNTGLSLFSGSENNFYSLAKYKEFWILENYQNCNFHKEINLPYTYLRDLQVFSNKLICIASNDISHERLLEIEVDKFKNIFYSPNESIFKEFSFYSRAESYWFSGFCNKETHSWIYKPFVMNATKPPLLLKVHGGPTAVFDGVLNLEVQYWVSRGWFVAELNYGGSSGFGKEYRNRLNNYWGIVDSYDCKALVQSLIQNKFIDPSRIVISGNSAGGFTALNSLISNDIFTAAICKYPVIDLNEMRLNTHRFERNYLNSLIGDFKNNKSKYFKRSPKNNLNKINKPILLFHGKKDSVVNYEESLDFHKRLLENNVYSKIFLFDDEGHGFKNKTNKITVLEKIEEFIKFIFNN